MTSEKGKWRQEISDYDILFIKAEWFVNQNNRPLPFANQESNGGGKQLKATICSLLWRNDFIK